MQRTYPIIYKSKKQKKVLPWQHLLPCISEEPVSSNPYRGLECKELTRKRIANLISKLNFYKLIPYPMDNC